MNEPLPRFDKNSRLREAKAAHASNDIGLAEQLCLRILRHEPSDPDAKLLLGTVAGQKGRLNESRRLFEEVLSADPTNVAAMNRMAIFLRETGRLADSVAYCHKAITLAPGDAESHNNMGYCHLMRKEPAEAAACFSRATKCDPQLFTAYHNLGMARQQEGKFEESLEAFTRALELAPDSVPTLIVTAQLLMNWGKYKDAESYIERALAIEPGHFRLNLVWGELLAEMNRNAESERVLRRAAELDPRYAADAYAGLGTPLLQAGKFEEARDAFLRAIDLTPGHFAAYYGWAYSGKVREEDRPIIARMQALARSGNVPPIGLANLFYASGKAFDDLGEYEKAIRNFDTANRVASEYHFPSEKLDREGARAEVDADIAVFTQSYFEQNRNIGLDSRKPVLIVGMMRSGTTLTEQILSSHPQVGGAGELPFWIPRRPKLDTDEAGRPEAASLKGAAEDYLALLDEKFADRTRVCDKNPNNYRNLGLIHTVLPNASFIHVRRNPVDTCLSIYMTSFQGPRSFMFDRSDIVFWYQEYLRDMAHWRAVLPADRLLEISYENLIRDRERVSREMIEFIGLDWDEACLRPEENRRAVQTASFWQARQGVYSSSLERWRKYEPWLGAFRELLP